MNWIFRDTNIGRLEVDGKLLAISIYYQKINKQKLDRIIIVDGPEGSGKSNFAISLGALLDKNFEYNHIFWSAEEIVRNIKALGPGSTIIHDEATRDFDASDHVSRKSKRLEKALRMCREYRQNLILVHPNMWWLNNYTRSFRACIRFYCEMWFDADGVHRGKVTIFEPIHSKYNKNVYWDEKPDKLKFNVLPDPIEREYIKRKRAELDKFVEEGGAMNLTYKQIIRAIVEKKPDVTPKTKLYDICPTNILYDALREYGPDNGDGAGGDGGNVEKSKKSENDSVLH